MKYFSPDYWFNMWLLSLPLLVSNKNQAINANVIVNKQKINDYIGKNATNLMTNFLSLNFTNNNSINGINYQNFTNIQVSVNKLGNTSLRDSLLANKKDSHYQKSELKKEVNDRLLIIETKANVCDSGTVLKDKIYFPAEDGKVYEYDSKSQLQKVVINTNGTILASGTVLKDKIYFPAIDGKVYEYHPLTTVLNDVISANDSIFFSGTVLKDKIYFVATNGKVYEYDPKLASQKVIISANNSFLYSGTVLKDKIYFPAEDNKIYEYHPLIVNELENKHDNTSKNIDVIKWNDDFTKLANQQQHLSIISKANFSASNITSIS